MTILITGASGFLGGRLTQILAQKGEPVRILASKNNDLSHLEGLPIEVVYGRLEEEECLLTAVKGVNLIFHCAALSADWGAWERFYSSNVLGVKKLIQAASQVDTLERFLHVSTTDVYGYPDIPCDESHPIVDRGLPYNRSKGLSEKIVWEFYKKQGIPVTVIRPATIYGPRSKDFALEVSKLLRQGAMPLIDGGKNRAGLLYIDNAVEGIIKAAISPVTVGKAYNLRDETEETWEQYLYTLADGLGERRPWMNISKGIALATGHFFEILYGAIRIPARPVLTRHAVYLFGIDQGYPITSAKTDFGYGSKVSFEQGILETIHWLKSTMSIYKIGESKKIGIENPSQAAMNLKDLSRTGLEKPFYLENLQRSAESNLIGTLEPNMESTMNTDLQLCYERRKEINPINFNDRRRNQRRVLRTSVSIERRRLASKLRHFERENIKVPVCLESCNNSIFGYTENISLGGLMILTDVQLAIGIPVNINFSLGDSTCFIIFSGQTLYCHSLQDTTKQAIGIKFCGLQDSNQRILNIALEKLKQTSEMGGEASIKIRISQDILATKASEISSGEGKPQSSENALNLKRDPAKTTTTLQRRHHPRYLADLKGTIFLTSKEGKITQFNCKINSFSRYGISFETSQEVMLENSRYRINLTFPENNSAEADIQIHRQTATEKENIYAGELQFPQEDGRRRIHTFLKTFGADEIIDRRKGERRLATLAYRLERRNEDRRKSHGIFKECMSFAHRAPLWRATYTHFHPTESTRPGRVLIDGKEMISFGSKDYLGLAHDERVKEVAIKATERFGTSVSGSRVMNGTHTLHEELEHELALFKNQETAVVYSLGYLTNIGILTTLLRKDDVAFIDERAHGSIFDGCRYSGAKIVMFRHNSAKDLAEKIRRAKATRSLIIVDGVYSVEGDLAVLPEIKAISSMEGIPLMVDDAHGIGILGENGAGTTEHFGLLGQVDLDMGTFSAAFGGVGGFVACRKAVGDYLRHFSSAFTFTVGLPVPNIAAALEVLRIIKNDTTLRTRLWSNVKKFKSGLEQFNYPISATQSAVFAIRTGNETITYQMDKELRKRGVYVNSFCRPAAGRGEAILRLSMTSAHSDTDLDMALEAFKDVKRFLVPSETKPLFGPTTH